MPTWDSSIDTARLKAPPRPSPSHQYPSQNNNLTPFANDPVRGPLLSLAKGDVEALNGPKFLSSTSLIDYLLQQVTPKDLPHQIRVGSSNSLSWIEIQNRTRLNSKTKEEVESAQNDLRRKYQIYSLHRYHFIAVNCSRGHITVISVIFYFEADEAFQHVCVYDSIRKSSRKTEAPRSTSVPAHFLREFQLFWSSSVHLQQSTGKFFFETPKTLFRNVGM